MVEIGSLRSGAGKSTEDMFEAGAASAGESAGDMYEVGAASVGSR
ncbi:hypothetical protein ACQCVK_02980 [Rossellomorea vietnamensis]|nr:hypothetical protein [Rossellomorea aquimaris]